jgi:microcystin-dependent protein
MDNFKAETVSSGNSINNSIPTGGIIIISGPYSEYSNTKYTDVGLIPCDGRTLNATSNPEFLNLYNVIGTLYGGTGQSSFKVPLMSQYKVSIVGTKTGFASTNTVGTLVQNISHSHNISMTNNSFSVANSNVDHSHNYNWNDVGNMASESGHGHVTNGGSGTIGANIDKSGPAGTAGGGLNGNHSHNVNINSNNLGGGGGNNHYHPGGSNFNSGGTNPNAVSHGHSASITAPTVSTTYAVGEGAANPFGIPYANMLYFIRS